MALPVIADTYRVALNWNSSSGIRPVNVFHVYGPGTDAAGIGARVEDAIQAGVVPDNMFDAMSSAFDCTSCTVTPLDGVTPGQDFALTEFSGSASGDWTPQVAAVVSFKTGQRGARGRGRMYVGPVGEGKTTDGLLFNASATAMLAGWDAFFDSLDTSGSPLCVASYRHHDQHVVTSIRIDQVLGTQRRRQDQLR